MKASIAIVLLCSVPTILNCADAPRNAVYGREILNKDEHLLVSFSVHAKVLVVEGNLDKSLVPKAQPLPMYPGDALHAGIVGEATVVFTITKAGAVEGIKVMKSSHNEFARSSVAAVAQWAFSAPEHQGRPTQLSVRATFLFSMYDDQE